MEYFKIWVLAMEIKCAILTNKHVFMPMLQMVFWVKLMEANQTYGKRCKDLTRGYDVLSGISKYFFFYFKCLFNLRSKCILFCYILYVWLIVVAQLPLFLYLCNSTIIAFNLWAGQTSMCFSFLFIFSPSLKL